MRIAFTNSGSIDLMEDEKPLEKQNVTRALERILDSVKSLSHGSDAGYHHDILTESSILAVHPGDKKKILDALDLLQEELVVKPTQLYNKFISA